MTEEAKKDAPKTEEAAPYIIYHPLTL